MQYACIAIVAIVASAAGEMTLAAQLLGEKAGISLSLILILNIIVWGMCRVLSMVL